MRKFLPFAQRRCFQIALLICIFVLYGGICFVANDGTVHAQIFIASSESDETIRNLKYAQKYEEDRRYELAKQHYLLALSTCRTVKMRNHIQRYLQGVELQIRSLR